MDLHAKYPALSDLRARARRRVPRFVWDYLDSGTGTEATTRRNRAMLDRVLFMPSILHGEITSDPSCTFLGQSLQVPVGIAPVGMSGLVWPDAERLLARAATQAGLPYTLSTVASQTPETVGPEVGGKGWFQLYPPRDVEIRKDMLRRARDAGFDTLVLTADVPVASRRERQVRTGLRQPPVLTLRMLAQCAIRPAWSLGTARAGMPTMRTLEAYNNDTTRRDPTAHVGYMLRTSPDPDYVRWLRDAWEGPLVVKGVLKPSDAEFLTIQGVDAIWISNHSGRQFDGAPSSIEALSAIRPVTDLPLIVDGGFEGGLDILRAAAFGADLVMMGRPFHAALAALGASGPAHLIDILRKDMLANMGQLGFRTLQDARGKAIWDRGTPLTDL